ncbi:MAG: DUF262 domain-containing protein [Erysipelotrichaceae bacterium]
MMENEFEEKIFDEEEQEDLTTPLGGRKLYLDKTDKSTSDIKRLHDEGVLTLKPDFQREYVWSDKIASKFIESLFLGIPIPTVFLAEEDDGKYTVVDGQQRLTTIIKFMNGELKLTGLETLEEYNGKKYDKLDVTKSKFNNVSLPFVIVLMDSDESIKFDIFSRINQGSIKLNTQELYRVIYRGDLISMIDEVVKESKLNEIIGEKPIFFKRYGGHDIIIRFLAMKELVKVDNSFDSDNYGGRLNKVIIEFLKKKKNDVAYTNDAKKIILDTLEKVYNIFGTDAFKRPSRSEGSTNINRTIAELQMVTLSLLDIPKEKYGLVKNSFIEFFSEEATTNIFIRATNNTENVKKRYEWIDEVKQIIGDTDGTSD